MTKPSWYRISAKADEKTAEVDIYDEIGMWGIRASDFIRDLRATGDVSKIYVNINSPGGDVFDGLAIFNVLKRHPAEVNCRIDGIAASIASVIAMAGDVVSIPDNGFLMIHDPSGVAMGTAEDMRELADVLEKVKGSLISAYRQKTGMDDEEIANLMSAETWLTAEEAKSKGFVDEILEPMKMAASAVPSLARFTNVPAALAALAASSDSTQSVTTNQEEDMTEKKNDAGATPAKDDEPSKETAQIIDLNKVREESAATAKADAEKRMKDIVDLCALFGDKSLALDFIASAKTIDDIRAELLTLRAKKDSELGETDHKHSAASKEVVDKANNYGWDRIVAKAASHRFAAVAK